ncbi:MAG TPA: pyruvate kinase, partial [Bacteroidia bacterium]|nr:pyruvate kinase [Bacteroidia bacterium]
MPATDNSRKISYNRTKIVATLGPASSSPEMLEEMVRAGTDVFRINFSHGDYAAVESLLKNIRDINRKLSTHVSILGDLQGPK